MMSPERESKYIAAYLRRNFEFMRAWDAAETVRWVQWYMRRGRALSVYVKGRLVGVVLIRLLDDAKQAVDPFADTGGRVAYVEATAGDDGVMRVLFKHFRNVFPCADTMAWVRSKYHNRPVVVPMARAEARLLRS